MFTRCLAPGVNTSLLESATTSSLSVSPITEMASRIAVNTLRAAGTSYEVLVETPEDG